MSCTNVKKWQLFYWLHTKSLMSDYNQVKLRYFLAHTGKNFSLCTLQQGHRCRPPRWPPGPVSRVWPNERKDKGKVKEAINSWGVSKVKEHTLVLSHAPHLYLLYLYTHHLVRFYQITNQWHYTFTAKHLYGKSLHALSLFSG